MRETAFEIGLEAERPRLHVPRTILLLRAHQVVNTAPVDGAVPRRLDQQQPERTGTPCTRCSATRLGGEELQPEEQAEEELPADSDVPGGDARIHRP
jgi:hypothetical protein